MTFLDLPGELILQISTDLSWRDILSLQKTSRRLTSLLSIPLIDKVARDPTWCPRALFSACDGEAQDMQHSLLFLPTGAEDGFNPTVRRILTILSKKTAGYAEVLHKAVMTGNGRIVTTLLNNGADANTRATMTQRTPLHIAAANGLTEVVAQLVNRPDVDVNTRDVHLHRVSCENASLQCGTPLIEAVRRGHDEVVRLLLTDSCLDVNLPCAGTARPTPLYCAAGEGNVNVVRMLLADPRIDVNLGCLDNGNTPLHAAAAGPGYSGCDEVVRILVADSRVDVNIQGQWGYTPLHVAVGSGGGAGVKALLEKRDDVLLNIRGDWGCTPLHIAAERGSYSAVKRLLRKGGVDVNVRNWLDMTPFHVAAGRGDVDVIKLFLAHEKLEIAQLGEITRWYEV